MKLSAYWRLGRFDRPIGTWLLLWPTVCALFLAQHGQPNLRLLIIFILATVLMRTAGCIINDCFDKDFDIHVKRTKQRPLATQELTIKQALPFALVLIALSAGLVLLTNRMTILLSFCALALAIIYPLGKRITGMPQLILGVAFAWAVIMAFAAVQNAVPFSAWLFFLGTVAWVFGYDTLYGMVDAEDDKHIGVRSSALTLGEHAPLGVGFSYGVAVVCWGSVGYLEQLSYAFYLGLAVVVTHMVWQLIYTMNQSPERCFLAFKANHWLGAILLLSILAGCWIA